MLQQFLAVGAGGCVGAIARFTISAGVNRRFAAFAPAGTLAVNILGCLLIGVLMGLVRRGNLPESTRLFLITGCLGSLTTFSTFGFETVQLLQDGNPFSAATNIALNVFPGCMAVWLGLRIVQSLGG